MTKRIIKIITKIMLLCNCFFCFAAIKRKFKVRNPTAPNRKIKNFVLTSWQCTHGLYNDK